MPLPKIDYEKANVPQAEQEEVKKAWPAAGARSHESPPIGAAVVDDETFGLAAKTLRECLEATRPVWSKDKKDFVMEPDYPTRMAAVKLAYEYRIGRPVERRIELHANADTWDDHKRRAMSSPEGIRFMLAAGEITVLEAEEALQRCKSDSNKGGSE